jgi:hypothetical protein
VAIRPERSEGGGTRDAVGLPSPAEGFEARGAFGGRPEWLGEDRFTTIGEILAAGGEWEKEKRHPRKPLLDEAKLWGAFEGPALPPVVGGMLIDARGLLSDELALSSFKGS